MVEATVKSNDERKAQMIDRVLYACGGSVKGKKIALLGLTFKEGTDDMRDSPSIPLAESLIKHGAIVKAYDPEGMDVARTILPSEICYTNNVSTALHDADVAVVVTEWKEFCGLRPEDFASIMARKVIVDLRNIYDKEEFFAAGFSYYPVGSVPVEQIG